MAFGSFGEDREDIPNTEGETFNFEEYKESLAQEAEEALSKIEGAGNVRVILSFESTGKSVIARNSQSKTQTDTGNNDNKETKETAENVVVYGQGQNEKPYVTEEKMPLPSGILVIAQGAKNESVRYELYEAVKALYGISAHRIKITASEK